MATCQGTSEYTSQINDSLRLLFIPLFFLCVFIYSWNFHLIWMTFQDYLGAERIICCFWGGQGQKSGFSSNEPSEWRERERGEGGGMREQGFMCSLVNERQALKVTGCVYYWSVSRLMGRREEKREERAKLLSRDQSTQSWEPERAPSNKLCHTRSICPYRFILLHAELQ